MINSEFVGFLRFTVSPEAGDVFVNAYNALTQTGTTQHEFSITQYLGMADNEDTATTIASIEQCLRETLADRLGEHGIQLSEYPLPLMTELLLACNNIDSYGDPETIYNISTSDETPELRLCEIMEFFSPYLWTDYFSIIESVKEDFMASITALLRERADTAMEKDAEYLGELALPITDIRARVLRYTDGKPDLQILRIIREGAPLGLDMGLYVESCKAELATMAVQRLVPELTAIALASNLLTTDLSEAIKEQIEVLHGNANTITQANILLSREALA